MKIGRNHSCPCGSGKKYKRCCLGAREAFRNVTEPRLMSAEEVRQVVHARNKSEAERIERYGHVRPPISARHAGHTFVAVGSRLLYHAKWKTFHDFLFSYIGAVFEKDWFAAELRLPLEKRHPLMQWYQLWFDFWAARKSGVPTGEIVKVDGPPAQVSALLSFAYDLYTLEHHSLLPKRLVERLKRKDQFQGARYEMYVAAAFVRAGFTISLEDEDDRSSTHCEFSASHRQTNRKYSVEAKSRHRTGFLGQAGVPKPLSEIEADLKGLLVPALRKEAKHERIVFIDVNVPPSESAILESQWFNKVASQINRLEDSAQGKDLPSAIVFLTNFPYHFVEKDDPLHGSAAVFTGFNIPEFRSGDPVLVSKKHAEVLALHTSVLRHTAVPHDLS